MYDKLLKPRQSFRTILYNARLILLCKGRAMALGDSRRPLTAEGRFRSFANPCEICGVRCGTGVGFFSVHLRFSLSLSFYKCSILIFISILVLSEGQTGKPVNLQTKQCFRMSGSTAQKSTTLFWSVKDQLTRF